MQVSPNFTLQEFIDPETYRRFGHKSIWFIDLRMIAIAQLIRDLSDSAVTINSWNAGGRYQLSGFRPPSTTIGAGLSQHRFGRAIDVKVKGFTPEEIHHLISYNWSQFKLEGLTAIEDTAKTPTWNHLDCRPVFDPSELLIVRP